LQRVLLTVLKGLLLTELKDLLLATAPVLLCQQRQRLLRQSCMCGAP
jgi:hypothetical protein